MTILGLIIGEPPPSDKPALEQTALEVTSPDDGQSVKSKTAAADAAPTTPAAKSEPRPSPQIDEAGVLRSLRQYASLYNSSRYAEAVRHLSDRIVNECGRPIAMPFALSRNHDMEEIDFRVTSVRAWNDGSRKADVRLIERIGGSDEPTVLGLGPFIRERGMWVMDDLYPIGAGVFCD